MTNANEPPAGLLDYYERNLDYGRKTQAEHGKWLINTLYLLHSGSIAGILSRVPTDTVSHFIGPLRWFVVGIALAFLAGFATWSNYHWFIKAYGDLIRAIRRNEWQPDKMPPSAKFVGITMWIALGVGLGSFLCLVVGAWDTLANWQALQTIAKP